MPFRAWATITFVIGLTFLRPDQAQTADTPARPRVMVFDQGAECIHCTEQYRLFKAISSEFKRYEVRVEFVSPDAVIVGGTDSPFAHVRDKDGSLFRQHAKQADGDHGTFVFGPNGDVAWHSVGRSPYLDAREVLSAAVRTEVEVEIEINNTLSGTDDYLTWAPTPARARLAKNAPNGGDVTIVLTNDAEKPAPAGRAQPLDGNVVFADAVAAGRTADRATLVKQLPADGSWVPFVVAGQFPRASSADKDAVIEAHLDTIDGPRVATKAVMVRVRKELNSLTLEERAAYLKALHHLHVVQKRYERYPYIHDLAAKGKEDYFPFDMGKPHPNYYPDQAHRGAGFLPWHRAFLLLFERDLQKIDPAVTLPYWRQNADSQPAFTAGFMGTNKDDALGLFQGEVLFAPANWLYGWDISYQNLKTVVRNPKDYTTRLLLGNRRLVGDLEMFESATPVSSDYGLFSDQLETNPHNFGHGAIGAWHANCLISPSDPSFWSFHAEDDRLWAKWQWTYGRFDASGTDKLSYHFPGSFAANDPAVTYLGHNLKDKMWPWDGTSGEVVIDDQGKGRRPPSNPFPAFPQAPSAGLWPSAASMPTPAETIDYLNIGGNRLPHGVCYDDVPFGVKPPTPVVPPSDLVAGVLAEVAADNDAPLERRLRSLQALHSVTPGGAGPVFARLAADRSAPAAVRRSAIAGLFEVHPGKGIDRLMELTAGAEKATPFATETAVDLATLVHLNPASPDQRKRFHAILSEIADDSSSPELADQALLRLAQMGDKTASPRAVKLLKDANLAKPRRATLLATLAAQSTGAADPVLSELLKSALNQNDDQTVMVLLRLLAGDAGTRALRLSLIGKDEAVSPDFVASNRVQKAAFRSVMRESPEALSKALAVLGGTLGNPTSTSLKLEAAGAFRVAVESQGPFAAETLADWKQRLTVIHQAADTNADVKIVLAMALEVLDRVPPKK